MRTELAEILRGRYGDNGLSGVMLISPDKKQLEDYERHHGLTSLWINLERNPHLIVVDTGGFIHLRHVGLGLVRKKPSD